MDQEKNIPEETQEMDIFDREEHCIRTIKTVRKAVVMRLFVTAILIWAFFQSSREIWILALVAFVLLVNLAGLLPLVQELIQQRRKLKELIALEEENDLL